MTRINAAIPVEQLCDQHLMAEHREIKRIPNAVKAKFEKGQRVDVDKLPKFFKLGSGHVTFFYDKLLYLAIRYKRIYRECIRRGFNVTDYTESFIGVPNYLYNNWEPDSNVSIIVKARILERMHDMKSIRYMSKEVTQHDMLNKMSA